LSSTSFCEFIGQDLCWPAEQPMSSCLPFMTMKTSFFRENQDQKVAVMVNKLVLTQ